MTSNRNWRTLLKIREEIFCKSGKIGTYKSCKVGRVFKGRSFKFNCPYLPYWIHYVYQRNTYLITVRVSEYIFVYKLPERMVERDGAGYVNSIVMSTYTT